MSFDQDGVGPFLHELSGSFSTNLDADALYPSGQVTYQAPQSQDMVCT
ncbi:hypothetical protein FHY11_002231 [Xanthomonas arboricola]|nr:hypothetical protein [Xanthomonas euroxanthea]NIK08721.1 hypothetical protein [Xanthomonas euroxanthea]